jgi:flavorubredoxin
MALMVDTGVAYHEELILEQLQVVLPADRPLNLFVTRSELECVGNLRALSEAVELAAVYTGGNPNPFDAFDSVGSLGSGRRVPVIRVASGSRLDLGGTAQLEVLVPSLRILATYWAYDPTTRTLFTSDSFGHTMSDSGSQDRVQDSPVLDRARARELMLAKFGWLTDADTSALKDDLHRIFHEHDIEVIAPTHGLVLRGREVVKEHLDFVLSVLSEFAPARDQSSSPRSA